MRTMSSSAAIPEGFNRRRISVLRWRRRGRALVAVLAAGIPVALAGYYVVDFLARTPRERRLASRSFLERVMYGARMNSVLAWNWLTAEQDDPKGTSLPVMELYIRQERIKALNAHLPQSGKFFQPGVFKVRVKGQPNEVFSANLRYRGDSMNHWAFPQKSWRIKLKRKARYLGMRQFNLYLPRTKSQVPDFLGYRLAESMGGLIVPKAFPVHLRVNRKFDGLRVFLEQINDDFFVNHHLPAETLLIGDIGFKDVYDYQSRKLLFKDAGAWEVVPVASKDAKAVSQLQALVTLLPLAEPEPERFKREVEALLDVRSTLRYMAYLEVVDSVHADDTHNQRFYLSKETKKLHPIVWDPVAYYRESNEGIDFASNELFVALLLIPEYRNEKNRYIWEAINGPLGPERIEAMISASAESIRQEIMASPQKVFTHRSNLDILLNSQWSTSVRQLVEKMRIRSSVLVDSLAKHSVVATVADSRPGMEDISITVGADSGVLIKEIVLEGGSSSKASLRVTQGEATSTVAMFDPKSQGYVVPVSLFVSSSRKIDKNGNLIRESTTVAIPLTFNNPAARVRELRAENTVTGEIVTIPVKRGA
jgi:hypothetical protein